MPNLQELQDLVEQGNAYRNSNQPEKALVCYAQVFSVFPDNPHAWNNYGNVMREIGNPLHAIPFLENAIRIDPEYVTGQFNLAVAYLLAGDLKRGFEKYEWRWQYEHLAGRRPKFEQPHWEGEDLKGKTILVCWEQGLGDTIQFSRFCKELYEMGATVKFWCHDGMKELFANNEYIHQADNVRENLGEFDYWVMLMSLPRVLKTTYETLPHQIDFIKAHPSIIESWRQTLGIKTKPRIGVCWSGRKDSWIHIHKAMDVSKMLELVNAHPEFDWVSLQADTTQEEHMQIVNSPLKIYPGKVKHWADTAGLVHHLDLVISIDTAIAHLAGTMGKQLWIPLNNYGTDWRYLTRTALSPWYPTARIIRQPNLGDWDSVINLLSVYLNKGCI